MDDKELQDKLSKIRKPQSHTEQEKRTESTSESNHNSSQNEESRRKIPNKAGKKKPFKGINFMFIYIIITILLFSISIFGSSDPVEIDYNRFASEMLEPHDVDKLVVYKDSDIFYINVFIKKDKLSQDKYSDLGDAAKDSNYNHAQYYFTEVSFTSFENRINKIQKDLPAEERVSIVFKKETSIWSNWLVQIIISVGLFVVVWFFLMKRVVGGGGGAQIFNIGKSRAQLYSDANKSNTTFEDVAGLQEAKEEVVELVDFLKNPKKYTELGAKIPKGVLLVGPPGTGKTLLAKAVAGQAQVPFFSISGSDFVEMFVGVGASRVRDLFKQAKEKAPCIVFIDEIDAIGRARGKNSIMGGNDERENTLNQLLVEMDGFGTNSGVIIMAATNRSDVLDGALLRAGRFDRLVAIDKPDLKGREEIFTVHLRPLTKLAKDVDPVKLAELTPGFAGADIANICNEAALICARKNKKKIDLSDFQAALDRAIGGLEKKNKIISPEEKNIVAYHEAGHAIVGWFLQHTDMLLKVTIVPRGIAALGYAQYLPKEQYLYTREQLMDTICMALGGRVAEEIIFGRVSTGAQNDLERITKLAYSMVTLYGMNDKVGNISFNPNDQEYSLNKPYSDKTSQMIDEEVRNMISELYQKTKKLLSDKRTFLEIIAKELLEKEVLFSQDLERILGKKEVSAEHTHTPKPKRTVRAKKEKSEVKEETVSEVKPKKRATKPKKDKDTDKEA